MLAIREYTDRSETTTLRLAREEGLPAADNGGVWGSRTGLVDEWRRGRIEARGVDEVAGLSRRLRSRA